jgi:hypothetical protein
MAWRSTRIIRIWYKTIHDPRGLYELRMLNMR